MAAKGKHSAKPADPVTGYAQDVVARRVVAGRFVRLACERHLRDLKTGWKRGLEWKPGSRTGRPVRGTALYAIRFFHDALVFHEGAHAGQPFDLQPWEAFIVGSLWGWHGADGHRRFRTAYIEAGKGNGKTPLAAGIGILGLAADGEVGAEIYAAAVTREQSGILFRDAERMVAASPALRRRITSNVGNLAHLASGSFFRAVSSEARSLDGKRVHVALIDEIHEHPTATVVDKMRAGTKGRRQALIVEITNSGYDRHSVCFQHHEYSRQILEGVLDNDAWFAYVCGLDLCDRCREAGHRAPDCTQCDDHRNERVWPKANPNLGVSIPPTYLREQVLEAEGMPAKQNIVRRLNFCEWTEQADRWLDVGLWDEVQDPVSEQALAGRDCFAGLDLSSTWDMSALALLFPPTSEAERWQVLMRYWVPADNLAERVRRDRVPYHMWRDQGFLVATPGNCVDYDFIEDEVRKAAETFQIRELVYDRFFAGQLVTHLQAEGLTVVGFGQGFQSMTAPCKEFETLVRSRRLAHGGHPILRWNISNVAVRQDPAGNLKPDKDKSTERIDGVVALLNALGRAVVVPAERSTYEDNDLLVLE